MPDNGLQSEEFTGYAAGTEEPNIVGVPFPKGARFAVRIQLTLEDSDILPKISQSQDVIDYRALSARLYGPRTGIYRLLRVIEDKGCVSSVTTCGICGDKWPELVEEIAARGHEIVGHCYSQGQEMALLDEEADLEVVRRTVSALEKASGQRPVGWAGGGSRRGPHTVKSLLKEGFIYTNDFREADVPFVVGRLGKHRLIAMPRTDEINDNYAIHNYGSSPSNYVDYFKRAFDQLYQESDTEPGKVLTMVCHATVVGHPWGASAIAECCDYIKKHDDVWQTTSASIAEYYLDNLPT